MKIIAATHFLWAGLAVGIVLTPFDYLFLMVFAGFALVLARFIRVPGGFVIGTGFALKVLGVPDEQALAMRSEEHTSELQSRRNLVCRLLLEKKKDTFQHLLYS